MTTGRAVVRAAAVLAAAVAAGMAPTASAQIVDQGSFTITVDDARAGRETFVIRRGDQGYQASGTVLFADRRLSPTLSTDSTGAPVTYLAEIRVGTERRERVTVSRDRGLLTLRALWKGGESAREFPAPATEPGAIGGGTVLLDDDVAHHYYFLTLGARDGSVSVLVPRRRILSSARVERLGPDSVVVGGHAQPAQHVRLTDARDGDRDVWVDAAGRILKVAIPARKLVALRDAVPR